MSAVLRTIIVLGVLGSTLVFGGTVARAAGPLPSVLPAVRSWQPAVSGDFSWSSASRLVVDSGAAGLRPDADTFAEDLSYLNGSAPQVIVGPSNTAVPGDVVLRLDPTIPADEAYQVRIGPVTTITSRTAVGVYWGTRTMLQLIKRQPVLPAGVIDDSPQFRVRGFLLSIARMPVSWLDNFLRDMSYLKLNELTLNTFNMTDADITAVEAIAKQRHVKLIGWSNAPKFRTGYIPEQYRLTQLSDGKTVRDPINLDVMNPEATSWAVSRLDEQARRFSSDTFNIGGDEYPRWDVRTDRVNTTNYPDLYRQAMAKYNEAGAVQDAFRAYMNQANAVVRDQGKTARMWSDDITPATKVTLDSNLELMHWYNYGLTPAQLAAQGHTLINSSDSYLYFNINSAQNPAERIWNEFDPGTFRGGLRLPGGSADPALAGIQFCVWTVGGVYDAGRLERDLSSRMRPVAQKGWGTTPVSNTYAGALPTITAIGRAPGVIETPMFGDVGLGAAPAGPAMRYGNSQQLFTTTATGALHHSFWSATQGQVAEDLLPAGTVAGRPVAFNSAGDVLSVFTRGTNGTVRETAYKPGTGWRTSDWSAAAAANGFGTIRFAGDPAGFSFGSERHVFGAAADGRLGHLWWSPGDAKVHGDHWPGTITGTPVALVWGRVQMVYARGGNGNLHRWWWQAGDPRVVQRADLGIPVAAGAKLAGWTTSGTRQDLQGRNLLTARQHVVVVNPEGRVVHWMFDLDGDRPTSTDLTTATGVVATGGAAGYPDAAGHPVIFVRRATDRHLIRIRIPQSGPVVSDLTAVTPGTQVTPTGDPDGFRFDAELHAFASAGSSPRHHWWSTPADQPRQDSWR
ncbi:family 20 glycosylhydrolase [Kribbella deserti]|uniref:Family 20 glycosylhydrolase n=1 Tax=Kribbella deserti TaxID=1926257 RepID=A0ABV6QF27_9ACTN